MHTSDKLRAEKRSRTYYQSIVYDVCNKLDRVYTPPCVCGTADSPTTQVQDRLASLIEYRNQIAPSPDLQGELVEFANAVIGAAMTVEPRLGTAEWRLNQLATYAKHLLAKLPATTTNPNHEGDER